MQTATDFIKEELDKLGLLDKGQVMTNIFEKAKKIEHNQIGYTKEDVLKAGEIGEINHHDYKHIVKLLDEAREINETYGSNGSDETKTNNMKTGTSSLMDSHLVDFSNKNAHLIKSNSTTSSQTEISDEEIYKEAEHKSKIFRGWTTYETSAWVMACQWYREQLKKKGNENKSNSSI